MPKPLYLRLIVGKTHGSHGNRSGVFHACYELRREQRLSPQEDDELSASLKWFERNLTTPNRFTRSGYSRAESTALSWFKPSATDCIKRIRRMVEILEAHGILAEILKTDRPGYVVYEDDHQIVATPFADTPTGGHVRRSPKNRAARPQPGPRAYRKTKR